MSQQTTNLGPFTLGEGIGEGGMGKVFSATHQDTGVPVAIKFAHHISTERERIHFHREVQAQASLVHPGVVYLFDYGQVDPAVAADTVEKLPAHSPYVVMELAGRGSVRNLMPAQNWSAVRNILLAVLDALAFAHARGVIHRDLKPENWLVFDDDGDSLIKLADFGLAHSFSTIPESSEETLEEISGTPYYMAPEQIQGEWRSFGPWTDLYSLGCVAWELVCGRPPFRGDSPFAIAIKHVNEPCPPLEPKFDVPSGVEGWIRKAVATDFKQRFHRAADAAWALPRATKPAPSSQSHARDTKETWPSDTLGMPTLGRGGTLSLHRIEPRDQKPRKTQSIASAPTLDAEPPQPVEASDENGANIDYEEEPVRDVRPPLPANWRAPKKRALPAHLLGTGLGLFGLREVPFVDRDKERDQIWKALHDAADQRRWKALIVTGASGTGKSRLVQWMATRAHEVGAVRLLEARHNPGGAVDAEGLAGMVQRVFRTWMLSRRELYRNLVERLPLLHAADPYRKSDARGLTQWIYPRADSDTNDGPSYHFASNRQRYALMERFLRRMSKHRLPLLWLDDLHHSDQSLGLIEYLLDHDKHSLGGLIVATVCTDLLTDDSKMAKRIDDLIDGEHCRRLPLDSIGTDDHRRVVEQMLPLAPELRDRVADRTEGNPLFAHQLLNHWIDAGAIRASSDGFQIGDGEAMPVPDDIHQLWMTRIERLLKDHDDDQRTALRRGLEAMAVAGRRINRSEWQALCNDGDYPSQRPLVAQLIDNGLASRHDEGWSFAHGLLVDSLQRQAAEAGRLSDHHLAWAQTLERRYADNLRPQAWRCALHWIEAGKPRRALDRLIDAFQWSYNLSDISQLEQCLRTRERLLDELGIGPDDEHRLKNELLRAKRFYLEGRSEQTVDRVREVIRKCRTSAHADLLLEARFFLAILYAWTGEIEEARKQLAENLNLATQQDHGYYQTKIAYYLGRIHYDLGEYDEADRLYWQALDSCVDEETKCFDHLWHRAERGWLLWSTGELKAAEQLCDEVRQLAREMGYHIIENHCLDALGNIARYQGRLDDAERHYDQALENALQIDDAHAELSARIFKLLVSLERKHADLSERRLKVARSMAEEMGDRQYEELFDVAQLVVDCRAERWERVRTIFAAYADGWPANRPLLIDHPRLLDMATDAAAEAGNQHWAMALSELAAELRAKLK